MLSLYDRRTIERALNSPLPSDLRALLSARIAALQSRVGGDTSDLTHYLVVQPGDTIAEIEREVGFSPLVNVIDGTPAGSVGFHPSWDWLKDHGGWFEMIVAVGDGGFAFVLLIQDVDGTDPELLRMCRRYAD